MLPILFSQTEPRDLEIKFCVFFGNLTGEEKGGKKRRGDERRGKKNRREEMRI